jgi:DNA-binding response OmpR family regulator
MTTNSVSQGQSEFREFPMGAARLGFAQSVRKKVLAMREMLPLIRAESSKEKRDELRRSLHALGMGARSLHIEALAQAVSDAVGRLDRAPTDAELPQRDIEALDRGLRAMPDLAWGQTETSARSIVTFGKPSMDPRFLAMVGGGAATTLTQLLELSASAHAIVVDADAPAALEIAEGIADEQESIPTIIVGKFMNRADVAPYIALGFQYILPRPVSFEQIELVLAEATRPASETASFGDDFGAMSVRELAARLGDQLQTELAGMGATQDADTTLALGRAVEIQAAMWGAIARIREVIAARSRGAVNFTAMLGATHLAPSLDLERSKNTRSAEAGRGNAADVSLKGRRILVVDDDPGVTWFIADLLRAQGCLVDEALDGESALLRAYSQAPELVISDILMPKMDGLQLCQALRRDPVLQHTPFLFLSWKEDLMQRVREMRYGANGFIRKESDIRAVVTRVQEALFSRCRLEARITASDALRGRIDGFTVYALIDIVSRARPDATIGVREGVFTYEVAIRNGEPVSVVRTNGQGEVLRGVEALALLLGVTSGRFSIEAGVDSVESELDASYREIVMTLVAEARATSRAVWSERMLSIGSIEWNQARLRECLVAMPGDLKRISQMLCAGATPRALLERGEVDAHTLESYLLFIARRGAIARVDSDSGQELSIRIELPAIVEEELRIAKETRAADQSLALAADSAEVSAPMTAVSMPPEPGAPLEVRAYDSTDVSTTEYAEEPSDEQRVTTNVDHTLYGGRLLELSPPAAVLTPRGPVEFTPSGSTKFKTPSPAFLNQEDVLSSPESFPSIPIQLEKSEGMLEQAMRAANREPVKVQNKKWLPVAIFGVSVIAGAGLMRTLASETTPAANVADAPLPVGVELRSGEGALQVDNDVPMRVDGVASAHAPNATLVLPVGTHTLSTPGITRSVEVKPMRLTRVRLRSNP